MYEQQSIEPDQEKRKKLVWEIDRRLQEDAARPIIYQYRLGTCHYPRVHGITRDGQQHLQRLAFRRRLARAIGVAGCAAEQLNATPKSEGRSR